MNSTDWYYDADTAPASYAELADHEFGFAAGHIKIINDGGGDLTFSFDGENDDGVIKTTEALNFAKTHKGKIWFKGGVAYRVFAWLDTE